MFVPLAPNAPFLSYTHIIPSNSHGPRINLTWSRPTEANGIIRNYTVFYSHNGVTKEKSFGQDVLSYLVDVLGGVTYQFHVQAVTIKPGPNASLTVTIPEYGRFSLTFSISLILTGITELAGIKCQR